MIDPGIANWQPPSKFSRSLQDGWRWALLLLFVSQPGGVFPRQALEIRIRETTPKLTWMNAKSAGDVDEVHG